MHLNPLGQKNRGRVSNGYKCEVSFKIVLHEFVASFLFCMATYIIHAELKQGDVFHDCFFFKDCSILQLFFCSNIRFYSHCISMCKYVFLL